jgi:hypothetical protein
MPWVPFAAPHKSLFDSLLTAQVLLENLVFITYGMHMERYNVRILLS